MAIGEKNDTPASLHYAMLGLDPIRVKLSLLRGWRSPSFPSWPSPDLFGGSPGHPTWYGAGSDGPDKPAMTYMQRCQNIWTAISAPVGLDPGISRCHTVGRDFKYDGWVSGFLGRAYGMHISLSGGLWFTVQQVRGLTQIKQGIYRITRKARYSGALRGVGS
jgi:hypothetical protein